MMDVKSGGKAAGGPAWLGSVDLSLPIDDDTVPTEIAIRALREAVEAGLAGRKLPKWDGRIDEW